MENNGEMNENDGIRWKHVENDETRWKQCEKYDAKGAPRVL